MQPHRRQPTRLPRPWDSPGRNTGVGCHFPLQCMKVKSESEVAQLCPALHDPMDHSPPGSSVRGLFQARALEWAAIAFSTVLTGYMSMSADGLVGVSALAHWVCPLPYCPISYSLHLPSDSLTTAGPRLLPAQKCRTTEGPWSGPPWP